MRPECAAGVIRHRTRDGELLCIATVSLDLIECTHKKNGPAKRPIVAVDNPHDPNGFRLPHSQVSLVRAAVLGIRL